jgi:hypothetical protein
MTLHLLIIGVALLSAVAGCAVSPNGGSPNYFSSGNSHHDGGDGDDAGSRGGNEAQEHRTTR